ncbi:MAG: amino acid adenylation domain-containing protein [Pseudomonadota bacterium]
MRYLLTHLIDNAADRRPGNLAMRCRDEELCYAALAERSNQLAHRLVESGIKRGDRVGILMHKRVECAIAIHGIMKAGAAYVPLDPLAPLERLAFVMRDCGISHLVIEPRKSPMASQLADMLELRSITGSEDEVPGVDDCASLEELEQFDGARPPDVKIMEQDLAYVLYTSGSTGVPKGIVHSHRSGLAWAETAAAAYALRSDDRISNYAPLHFDLSTLDYFAAALVGAATIAIPEEVTKLGASLANFVADERLTVLYTVPLALTQLARYTETTAVPWDALRWVLFGGEPMPVKTLNPLMARYPHVQFVNVYGPTETNGCTHFPIETAQVNSDALPIGRPYDNVEALVIDQHDNVVAAGTPGELVIRAPTLMRGYWGRDDLNAVCSYYRENAPGIADRFHRTGDLVNRRATGEIQFIGRKDRQIKTRGCRVDLDEVENVLGNCPGVTEAAVYAVDDAEGYRNIHATVTANADGLQLASLRAALRRKLPNYAIPVDIDVVAELPRTSTGKIDRVSLAARASDFHKPTTNAATAGR